MKIGIDFDNTIVNYDKVFHKVALEQSLIKSNLAVTKTAVRDYLRSKGENDIWTKLQGYVYGQRMLDANVFPGFIDFIGFANSNNIEVLIVSHKTLYPYLGKKYNLHISARGFISKFLINQDEKVFDKENTFFELTQEKKAMRISQESCDFFVDDLPEIFALRDFPHKTKKILFDPNSNHKKFNGGVTCPSWKNIQDLVSHEFFER
jgi:hypothetical protein